MASALAPKIPSGASRGIRARPERDPERASEPGRFCPLRVTSALRGVCARPGRGLLSSLFAGAAPAKLQDYGLVVFLLVRLLHSVLAQLEFGT